MSAQVPYTLDVEVTVKKTIRVTISSVSTPSNEEVLDVLQKEDLLSGEEVLSVESVSQVHEEVSSD